MDLKRLRSRLSWRIDEQATHEELTRDPSAPLRPPDGGGRVVYVDDEGVRRRLPADLDTLTPAQRDAVLQAGARAFGAQPMDAARAAALERLSELHASGRMSDADFERERRRLEGYGR